ncbi:MAG: hypothetical protein ACRC3J_05540 [Culicoidibacterales bacterium]
MNNAELKKAASEIEQKWLNGGDIEIENEAELDIVAKLVADKLDEAAAHYAIFEEDGIGLAEKLLKTEQTVFALALLSIAESESIVETIVKHVDSRGTITRKKDRHTRARLATQTTGISKSKRRAIARKMAKTKRANPSATIRANRKRKRAMNRRKSMGF